MRASVIGSSGAGKSTFAARLAATVGVPHVELDAIYHQANWTPLSDDEFRARVAVVVAGDGWVIDGNYAVVRPLVLDRATTVAWLDYSRWVVMSRVIRRSVSRAITRRELWNGNRERPSTWLDSEHPIRWAWTHFDRKRAEYAERFASPEFQHLDVHRFRTPREATRWLKLVSTSTEQPRAT
jgi:adenylate kinase family enzyme